MTVEISLRELARATKISYKKLLYDCQKNQLPARRTGRRLMVSLDDPVIQAILADPAAYEQARKLPRRTFVYDGVAYPSVAALARAAGVSRATVYSWLRSGKVVSSE